MTDQISIAYIKLIDQMYFTPSERASGVLAYIEAQRAYDRKVNKDEGNPEFKNVPTDFDLLAFAIEYAGIQTIALDGPIDFMKEVSRWYYGIHYTNTKEMYGEADRMDGGVLNTEGKGEKEDEKD